jgi:branched-chain amino acid transport system permease protein
VDTADLGQPLCGPYCELILLALFYLVIKQTWLGRALRGASQNRVGIQTAGIDVLRLDMLAFGVGVSLAAAAGALLAPDFLICPENGAISTFKCFEIIVIGGLGSILGSIVGGVLLGVIEALGSVFSRRPTRISTAFCSSLSCWSAGPPGCSANASAPLKVVLCRECCSHGWFCVCQCGYGHYRVPLGTLLT